MKLTVHGLTVSRGGGAVLRALDLSIESGEVLALVGKNGAGKTTLLETIAGLLRPEAGSIEFDGRSLVRRRPDDVARRGIGLAPEGRRLFVNLTVQENLALGAHRRRWWWSGPGKAAYEPVWDLFPDLYEFRHRRVDALSGGQQQMVAVGRALMGAPTLLMLDEPTFGLSPQLTEAMCGHLVRLRGAGLSLLIAEQNIDVAIDVAPRLAVLSRGRIARIDEPGNLTDSPMFIEAMFGEQQTQPEGSI